MVRGIPGVLAGVAVAILSIVIGEFILHALVPLPMPDPTDAAAMETLIASAPLAAKWGVVAVYCLASLLGAFTAVRITGKTWTNWITMAVMIAAIAANFLMLPHPVWLVVTTMVLIGFGSRAGAILGRPRPVPAG